MHIHIQFSRLFWLLQYINISWLLLSIELKTNASNACYISFATRNILQLTQFVNQKMKIQSGVKFATLEQLGMSHSIEILV